MTLISYWYDVRHGDFGTIATNGPTAIGQKSTEEVSRCLYRLHKSDTDWLLVPLIVRFSKHREPTLSNRHHKETQMKNHFPHLLVCLFTDDEDVTHTQKTKPHPTPFV